MRFIKYLVLNHAPSGRRSFLQNSLNCVEHVSEYFCPDRQRVAGQSGRLHPPIERDTKFYFNWQIIDWTALTDMANGNALKAPTPMSLNLF
jgi:hypothetical protein